MFYKTAPYLFLSLLLMACSKSETFNLRSFNSQIIQSPITSKSARPQTEIITTINGESHSLTLEEDLFYDLGEDEYIHLLQGYEDAFEVAEQFVSIRVFFDILTDQNQNKTVSCLPTGDDQPCIPVTNRMTININGEETEINVDAAQVDGYRVRYDDGTYAFDISI